MCSMPAAATRPAGGLPLAVALVLALGLAPLIGCAPGGRLERWPSGAFSVTVQPGETGTCALTPCRVFLVMPPGDGTYRVTGNQVDFGEYPAGKTVNLGNFDAPIAIAIEGAGVPRAYVWIPVSFH